MAYVCFVVDAFSRTIIGWRVPPHMRTSMVLDALEMGRWSGAELGAVPSTGGVGDSFDNAWRRP